MSEEEIIKILEDACIFDELCHEVDCLEEKQLEAIRGLYALYKKEKNLQKERTRGDAIDEMTMLKQIKTKLQEENIPIETLLAEFNRLEDLEDKTDELKIRIKELEELLEEKTMRVGFENQENYISKDKIRDKIKELEQEKELYFEKQVIQGRIDLLKELLEE